MRILTAAIALMLACVAQPGLAQSALNQSALNRSTGSAPVILISIDGFRADYLNRGVSPTLSALAASGVRAERMEPSFPSVTFPNHTTLVTGLYPDHNGIVNNNFADPAVPGLFSMASKAERWWSESTPIWVSAERAGMHTGVMFWPGVSVAHDGVRPGLWHDFDRKIAPDDRVDTVLGWFDLPTDQRPRLALLYFEAVDSAGHGFGPDSHEVNDAITATDAAVARLVAGLKTRGIMPNLIVVSDHGMAPVGANNLVMLDTVIDLAAVKVAFDGTVVGIDIPDTPRAKKARRALLRHQHHMQCWDKAKIPADLHYGTNPRVPDVVCAAQTGWLVLTREGFARGQAAHPGVEKGAHGYDIHDPVMGALFIANGPAFQTGLVIPPFPNVDVYPLMTRLLGITPLPNDGRVADLAAALKP